MLVNSNVSPKGLLGRGMSGGLPENLWDRVQLAREKLVHANALADLERLDGVYENAAEGYLEGDDFNRPFGLIHVGYSLSAVGALALGGGLAGAGGAYAATSGLLQLCGVAAQTAGEVGMFTGFLGMLGGIVGGPMAGAWLGSVPTKALAERNLRQECDRVLDSGYTPAADPRMGKLARAEQLLQQTPSQASRVAGAVLGGALGAWHVAPLGAITFIFAGLAVPAAALWGAGSGGGDGWNHGVKPLVGIAVGSALGLAAGAALAHQFGITDLGAVAIMAGTSAVTASLGSSLSNRGRSTLEKDLDRLCDWVRQNQEEDPRVLARTDVGLRKMVAWLAAHPELGPDLQKQLMELVKEAPDRADFFKTFRQHVADGKIEERNVGSVLRYLVRNALLKDKLAEALTAALDPASGAAVEEKAGRVVIGGIAVRVKAA